MLKDIIDELGTVRVADACGVTPACVSIWKRKNRLPARAGQVMGRTAHYEKSIARLAGISVQELRLRLKDQAA